jgi:hypothetical protein
MSKDVNVPGFVFDPGAKSFVHNKTQLRFVHCPQQTVDLGYDAVLHGKLATELKNRSEVLLVDPALLVSKQIQLQEMLVAVEPVSLEVAARYCDDELHRPEFTGWSRSEQPAYASLDRALEFCADFGFELTSVDDITARARSSTDELYDFGAMPLEERELEAVLLPKLGRYATLEKAKLGATCYSHWTRTKCETGEMMLRGGGAELWPWQGTGEWQLCLSAAAWKETTNFMETAAFRPIVML